MNGPGLANSGIKNICWRMKGILDLRKQVEIVSFIKSGRKGFSRQRGLFASVCPIERDSELKMRLCPVMKKPSNYYRLLKLVCVNLLNCFVNVGNKHMIIHDHHQIPLLDTASNQAISLSFARHPSIPAKTLLIDQKIAF